MSSQPKTFFTPEEYLQLERKAEFKSEYFQGEIFAMAGASPNHGQIVTNLARELSLRLKSKRCNVYPSDVRLRVSPMGLYTYPDLMVVGGGPKFADNQKDTVLNPQVVIEVLSPSTRNYDRAEKFEQYRTLASLQEYLTIAQDRPHLECWVRQADNTWLLTELSDLNQTVQLASLGCELPLTEIYHMVEWAV